MTHRERLDGVFAAWAAGDALRSVAAFAMDARYGEAGRAPIEGRTAILEHFTRFFRDGPRFEFLVDAVLVEGERAAVEYRFVTIGALGHRRETSGCALVRFRDGTIVEWREYQG